MSERLVTEIESLKSACMAAFKDASRFKNRAEVAEAMLIEVRKLLLWAADSFDAHANAADHPEEADAYQQSAKMYRDAIERVDSIL